MAKQPAILQQIHTGEDRVPEIVDAHIYLARQMFGVCVQTGQYFANRLAAQETAHVDRSQTAFEPGEQFRIDGFGIFYTGRRRRGAGIDGVAAIRQRPADIFKLVSLDGQVVPPAERFENVAGKQRDQSAK